MADGSLVFDTKIDNKGFNNGVKKLQSVGSKAFKAVGKSAIAASAAIGGLGAAAIKVGSDFEKGMSQVAATMGISAQAIREGDKSFQALEKAAMDAGSSTQFSATQASEALNYLALAGYDAEKSIDALPKVLNLAAAGGLELGYASDLVTDSMSALGMEMSELESFTDELAKTSQKSNTSVGQLGEAILTVGGTAKTLAGGTNELNTALGILADNGIKGAEGGTALRNMILSLSAPTDKAANKMKDLGLEVFDAEGKMRPLNEIFKDLDASLAQMTEGEKTKVLNTIFNKVDLKSANALLANSGERFEELSRYIEDADGAAAQMAETMNDNLQGQLTILKSSLEGLGIQIYKGLEEPLKEAAKGAIEAVGQLSEAFEQGGFAGLVEEIGNVLANAVIAIAEYAPMMFDAAINMIKAFINGIRENLPIIANATLELIQSFITTTWEILPEILNLGIQLVITLVQGISQMIPELIPVAVNSINTIVDTIIENLPLLIESGIKILMAIVNGIINNLPTVIETGVQTVLAVMQGISDALPELLESAIKIITRLTQNLMENVELLFNGALEIVNALVKFLVQNIPLLTEAALKIVTSLVEFLIDNLPLLIDSAMELVMAIVEGLINNVDLLVDAALHLVLGIVQGLLNNLPLLVEAAIQLVYAIIDGLLQMIPQLVSTGIELVLELIGAILSMIPQVISTGVQLLGELIIGILKAAPRLLKVGVTLVKTVIDGVKSAFSGMVNVGKDLVRGLWDGIISLKDWILRKVRGFADSIIGGIKGVFGINSPSRIMRDEVGENLTLGIGVGLEKGMPDLQKDAQKELSSLTKKMKATVDFESNSIGTKITAGTTGNKETNNIVNNNDNGVTQNVTIVNPENTPSENARELKKVGRDLALGY